MKKNIAVIGCGHWGKNHVRNFAELGSLGAVCDPDKTLSSKFADLYSVKNLSFDQILKDKSIEGVVLATPAPLHASMSIKAMDEGKSVFVEKPISMNEEEAKEMINASKRNNVELMVGHLLQYHPIFKRLLSMSNSGEFGELRYIYSNRLSLGKIRSNEDVIWSFAPHDISMILALAKCEPNKVVTQRLISIQKNITDIATIHIDFPSSLKSHVSVSWINPCKEHKLVVIGNKSMAVFDDTKPWSEKLAIYKHIVEIQDIPPTISKADVIYVDVPESEPLRNECSHFIDVVNNSKKPLTDGEEGLRVLKVLSRASKNVK